MSLGLFLIHTYQHIVFLRRPRPSSSHQSGTSVYVRVKTRQGKKKIERNGMVTRRYYSIRVDIESH